MKDFRELKVWEKSHNFVLSIYGVTKQFPADERYGLTSQLRRAVSSIPTNIAEGCGRSSDIEFARFLEIGFSSACESDYLLLLSADLNYLNHEKQMELKKQLSEIKRMLSSFIKKLRADR